MMKHKRSNGKEAKSACLAAYRRGCQGSQGLGCDGCPLYEREIPAGSDDYGLIGVYIPPNEYPLHRPPLQNHTDPYDLARVLLGQ